LRTGRQRYTVDIISRSLEVQIRISDPIEACSSRHVACNPQEFELPPVFEMSLLIGEHR